MPITLARAERHVKEQASRLTANRSRWPHFLYHACDVTTAVNIVRHNELRSRNEAADFLDVANGGALNIFDGAHSCARLYFRPKNGFHFRTEGIKCIADQWRLPNHMSIPVMFLFDFVSVITLPGAKFSNGNVQRAKMFLDGDASFNQLDFDAVYHDAPTTPDNKEYITNMRMSEVSVEGRVPLAPHLRAIVFRTQSDMRTFEYLLEMAGIHCPYKLLVERARGTLFLARALYLNDLSFAGNTISLTFNFPTDFSPPDRIFKVYINQTVGHISNTYDKSVELRAPTFNVTNYNPDKSGVWLIRLEDQLAFRGRLQAEPSELF
ncbi:DarT ssDNA thymidine ADP-ribosyltransferase family protein [Mesorhizobium sp. B4-1-3]|uniref:DarT ssDNA thymidine ADP-ribosyltransferase family protein n=1 Tax=Mesorhizobium sp. B4-1-3 TaxID=2589889 RepID=UPI0015E30AC6|nr:DarT ssDNA thymidine ADP-ribosyltransferase family protein [Mesorhizobium sp. B4-1-3]